MEKNIQHLAGDYAISHYEQGKTYSDLEVHKMLADAFIAGKENECKNEDRPICGDGAGPLHFQQRLVKERKEMLEKTIALKKKLDDPFVRLTAREWDMLRQQFSAMREYLQILTDRCIYYKLIESGELCIHC